MRRGRGRCQDFGVDPGPSGPLGDAVQVPVGEVRVAAVPGKPVGAAVAAAAAAGGGVLGGGRG